MATTVGPIITKVLQRVRDPQGSAHSRNFVRTILGHAQRVVNSLLGLVLENTNLSVQPGLLVYPASSSVPNAVNIIDVVHQGRSLHRSDLDKLRGINSNWPRARGAHFDIYAPIGKDLLILYPGIQAQDTVDVHYIKDTGVISKETDTVQIAKDFEPLMEQMAEALLLLKQRDLGEAENAIKQFEARVGEVQRG